jgi:NAD(P)-dependent dehydrogenase (short-subunit alcohol dehydrogenase family)
MASAELSHEERNIHCWGEAVIDYGEHSYRGRARLQGITALVTEADSGLGRAVAIAFAREGAIVSLCHRAEPAGIAETRKWVENGKPVAAVFDADLTTTEGHQDLVDRVSRERDPLRVLVVNTAFDWLHALPADADITERERVFRTSLEASFRFALAISAHMADESSIVLTAPMRYAHPIEPARALVANARGFQNMTSSLASSLAARRIRVNAIVPGPVCVPRVIAQLPPDVRSDFGSETLLGRAAQPVELAPAFVFLAASAESGFVNGAVLEVTGGASAPPPALE